MSAEAFLDTNVLVYAAAGRGVEEPKRRVAMDLIDRIDFALSTQVLQEFYVTVVHKLERPMSPVLALDWIEQLEVFPCLALDSALVKIAATVSAEHQISYWDAAIVAAAQEMGATTLFTEDLNDGQDYGGVVAHNPFT